MDSELFGYIYVYVRSQGVVRMYNQATTTDESLFRGFCVVFWSEDHKCIEILKHSLTFIKAKIFIVTQVHEYIIM